MVGNAVPLAGLARYAGMRKSPVGTSTSPAIRPSLPVVMVAAVIGMTAAANPSGSLDNWGVITERHFNKARNCSRHLSGVGESALMIATLPGPAGLQRWRKRADGAPAKIEISGTPAAAAACWPAESYPV